MGVTLVEGDDDHSPTSREKNGQGIPLTDADREGWLETLGGLPVGQGGGTDLFVAEEAYRDRLRAAAAPGVLSIWTSARKKRCVASRRARGIISSRPVWSTASFRNRRWATRFDATGRCPCQRWRSP